ncbi:hypothetical protein [Clostridium saccharoperbutylacetonicum]|uniref:hypothetical protein n=1 Tax=Clostridium saccharoperbutylacetonicum TaxID=36745 RepID=UPI000983AE61|nr:hypothetical protein [Clostridium saccharoperbutylacetonicum]AQR98199.1 hypothetical protein CLSAP_55540 [Clostridium saccharoperbutylacetonicum]NSB34094.1 hypothetical protein [Clostridium saccharoperbutylacetonicum]
MENTNVYQRKSESEIKKEAFNKPLFEECFCCGKKKKLIDSHTVPQFILKNLSKPFKYRTSFQIEDGLSAKHKVGLKNAGVFRMLCDSCDSGTFEAYEKSEDVLLSFDSSNDCQLMLDQIALKNLYKKVYDYTYWSKYLTTLKKYACPKKLSKRNIDDEIEQLQAKISACMYEVARIFDTKHNNEILYNELLDYVIPIAAQGCFCLNYKKVKSIEVDKVTYIHLALFPLKEKSRIILFANNYNEYYNDWIIKFNKLSVENKLKTINDFVYMELDDYFLDSSISENDFSFLRYNSLTDYINRKDEIEIPVNYLESKFDIKLKTEKN